MAAGRVVTGATATGPGIGGVMITTTVGEAIDITAQTYVIGIAIIETTVIEADPRVGIVGEEMIGIGRTETIVEAIVIGPRTNQEPAPPIWLRLRKSLRCCKVNWIS
mmetsp:Transcript_58163/g.118436  ORF Transcript_58163/g.118436 Transcript_58163/m.118436 type:complete len:107 (-) Transcript_58163:98-418(-)